MKEKNTGKRVEKVGNYITITAILGNLLVSSFPLQAVAQTSKSDSTTVKKEKQNKNSSFTNNKSTLPDSFLNYDYDSSEESTQSSSNEEPTSSTTDETSSSSTEDTSSSSEEPQVPVDELQWVKDMFPYLTDEKDIETASEWFNTDGTVKINVLGFKGGLTLSLGDKLVSLVSDNATGDKMYIGNEEKNIADETQLTGEEAVKHIIKIAQTDSIQTMKLDDKVKGKDIETVKSPSNTPLKYIDFKQYYIYNTTVKTVTTDETQFFS